MMYQPGVLLLDETCLIITLIKLEQYKDNEKIT